MFSNKEYVYEVYRQRSFSKAAQNLYISQPSLSATIRRVEKEIGAPIFDRSCSPLQLTECGREYIRCIEKIMDIENGFENYLSDANDLLAGQLSIGGSNFFTSFVLPPLLQSFSSRYPRVRIRVTESATTLLEEELARGNLDLILDNASFNKELYTGQLFCTDRLLLAVPNRFAELLPREGRMRIQDIAENRHLQPDIRCPDIPLLEKLPFLLLKNGNDTRHRTNGLFQRYGIRPEIVLELDQQATAYHLACYGMACTIVSDQLIKTAKNQADIWFYKLNDENMIQNVYFYHKKNRYVTRSMEAFLEEVKNYPGL